MTFDYNHFPGRIKGIRLYLACIICLDPVCLSLGCLTFTQRMTVTWPALTQSADPPPPAAGGALSVRQAGPGMNRACYLKVCEEVVNLYFSLTFIISAPKWNICKSYCPITREIFFLSTRLTEMTMFK